MTLHVQNTSIFFNRGQICYLPHISSLFNIATNQRQIDQQNVSPNSAAPGASASLSEMSEPALKRPKIGFHDNNRGWRNQKNKEATGYSKWDERYMQVVHGFEGHEWEHEMMSRWWQLQISFIFTPIPWGRWTNFDEHIFQRGWLNHQLDY